MKKWRKVFITLGIILTLIVIGISAIFITTSRTLSAYHNFNFTDLDLTVVEDGTYTGNEDGGIVKASVEVTVKDHTITKVILLSHDNGLGKPAEVIVNDIVKQNKLEVDTISGATYSSEVIRMAVYNALSDK
jgi:uncharacterized protein with FMN-binding domain